MKMRNLAIISLIILGLALAACTRQASTAPVPTKPAAQNLPQEQPSEDATMAAVRLTAAVRATQSVAETQAAEVKGVETPAAQEITPMPQEPTPAAAQVATPTPAAVVPSPTVAPAAKVCPNPYIVKQGDWIYKIARDCKLDPKAIIAANPGINANFITPGQKLNLPMGASAQSSQSACSGNYTVVQGDTLFHIAYRCGLTTEQLAAANGIRYPFVIHPGDVLKLP
jgi:LysM repeat protein